ncbi:hypothetical protein ACVOMS_26075 [Bradyrhizobium guangxiense]
MPGIDRSSRRRSRLGARGQLLERAVDRDRLQDLGVRRHHLQRAFERLAKQRMVFDNQKSRHVSAISNALPDVELA